MVDHVKLPNLATVAVVDGLIYFSRKMKSFRSLEGRRYDTIQFELIHSLSQLLQSKTFFHARNRGLSPLPLRPTFVGTPAMRARSFQPKACYSHKKGVCVYTSIGSGSSI